MPSKRLSPTERQAMADQTAAENRARLEAEGAYVSPKRGEVEDTRAGAVEPPLMDADPSQAEFLNQIADTWKDELTPQSQDELDAAVIMAFHNQGVIKPKGLHNKLAEVMDEASRIPKRGTAPKEMGGYQFVQVGDAADPIRKALSARGITMMPHDIETVDLRYEAGKNHNMNLHTIKTTWRLTDGETGEFFDLPSLGTGGDTSDKFSPKAQTNAMKYALLMGFLLSTGDDPEASNPDPEPQQGAPITITGSAIEGVRQGGRQTKVTTVQLDRVRARARELELSPESLTLLIASSLGGRSPDIDSLESVNAQQAAVMEFLKELSFEDAGSVVDTLDNIPDALEAALAPEDVGAK